MPNIYVSWSTSELRVRLAPWNRFKPSIKYFTDLPRRYFFCGSFVFFLSYVCYAFMRVCLFVHCGHLLGKGWPLGSRLLCLTVSLSLSHWYPGSGVVLDCIDYWSLHPYLLLYHWSQQNCWVRTDKACIHVEPILRWSMEYLYVLMPVNLFIFSQNWQGLANTQKRRVWYLIVSIPELCLLPYFSILLSQKYSIICLQDIHLERKKEAYVKSEWGGQ